MVEMCLWAFVIIAILDGSPLLGIVLALLLTVG